MFVFLLRVCVLFLSLWMAEVSAAEKIQSIRVWKAPEYTRIVFDLTGAIDHQVFMLDNPSRLVLDLSGTQSPKKLSKLDFSNTPVSGIRHAKRGKKNVRFVIDMKTKQP